MMKKQKEFLTLGVSTLLIGAILLGIFCFTNWYVIHPALYIMIILMGIGWTATAITSILANK